MFPVPKIYLGVILSLFFSSFFLIKTEAQNCVLICNDTINVDLQIDGNRVILPDMLLEDTSACVGPKRVDVFVAGTSIGDTINCSLEGRILTTRVTFLGTPSNFCESHIRIEDKSGPEIICPDTIVACGVDPDSVALASIRDNCDPDPVLFYRDSIIDSFCVANVFNAIIYRTWGARDNKNNLSRPCRQEIFFKKATLSDVVFPNDTILTDTFSIPVTPGNIDSITGVTPPTIDGYPIGFYCKFNVFSEDQVFPGCEGSFKILRKWTVLNCCTNIKRTDFQFIELVDTTPPVMDCQDTINVSASLTDCVANFRLPPANVTDNNTLNPSVKVIYPGGELSTNGGIITGIPLGTHEVLYVAEDDCGNKDTCTTIVGIIDDMAPEVVCVEKLTVNINSRGEGCIFAESFDAGSTDNCFIDSIASRRMDDTIYRDRVCFYCDDIPGPIQVFTRFIDSTGNYNECMTEVRPQDKLAPSITCPPDTMLNCTVDIQDTSITGVPTVIDNCDSILFSFTDDTTNLTLCNTGMIIRKWYAVDPAGLTDSCFQKITLIDTTETVFVNIPPDSVVYCPVDIDSIDAGIPEAISDCEKWFLSIQDSVFTQPCTTKVERTFLFREWCSGIDTIFFQTITVVDTTGPVWNNANGNLDAFFECADDVRLMGPTATDICASTVNVNLIGDTTITGSCPNDFIRELRYLAEDNCGNISEDTFLVTITVRDTTPPEVLGAPADTTVNCGVNLISPTVLSADNCGSSTIETMMNNLPTICPAVEMIQKLWIAEDECLNRDTIVQTITKIDTVPPTALAPTDSIYNCPEDIPPADPEVVFGEIDNCSDTVIVTLFQDDTVSNRCIDTLIRIYQLEDTCGNTSFVTHRLILLDTIPPRVQSCPGMLTDTVPSFFPGFPLCSGRIENLTATYLDNCPSSIITVRNDSPFADDTLSNDASGVYPIGLHKFKFYGTDECLNVNDLCEVELTVVEIDPPSISIIQPRLVNLDSNGMVMVMGTDVFSPEFTNDLCSGPVSYVITPNKFDCNDFTTNNPVVVQATAMDTFGNMITVQNATITLLDPTGACSSPPPMPPGTAAGSILTLQNTLLENVEISMSGDMTGTYLTDTHGGFVFDSLSFGAELTFSPYKNDDPLNGPSTYDLIMISKIILGQADHYSPYRHIAADINRDGKVTVRDINELRKMVLGIETEFSNNTSWRFVDRDYIFQNSSNPLMENFPEQITQVHNNSDLEMDFIAVKIGDLNNDMSTSPVNAVSERTNSEAIFLSNNAAFSNGEHLTFSLKSHQKLSGFQLELSFDKKLLSFEKLILKKPGLTENNFNLSMVETGTIKISLSENLSSEEDIFQIMFSTHGEGNLNEVIQIETASPFCEAYSPDLEILHPRLKFSEPSFDNDTSPVFELMQNRPNPFSEQTEIICRLGKESNVILEIFDMTGRRIFEERRRLAAGIRIFEIDNRHFDESGVYSYKLTTPFGVKTKRMVFVKR